MANSLLTPTIIAKEALRQLENNMVMGKLVYRDYESEFGDTKVGQTVQIRRPVNYALRTGATIDLQDTVEGKLDLTVDTQVGVDISFSSVDLTMTIENFSERYIKPAMIRIGNKIDQDVHALYYTIPNWVGTPGSAVDAFSDFALAPARLDEISVPQDGRVAVLNPSDYWALLPELKGLYLNDKAKTALEKAKVGMLGGCDTYMSQNNYTHLVGTQASDDPDIDGDNQVSTYASVKNTMTQTLNLKTVSNVSDWAKAGDVIEIANVYDVNPVTKATLPYLKQFTVMEDADSAATLVALTIYPAIIISGAYQTASAAPVDGAQVTIKGTSATNYRQNLVFNRNAFALACVPMELPEAAKIKARETYKGFSVRLVSDYDITNDRSIWRFDVLYGVKAIDPRQAVRLSGT
jgi:hypothetical protein